jgi:predicted nucleic acid-binding protein
MTAPRLFAAEPPSAYARRPRLIVDASLIAATIFAEEAGSTAVAWMQGRALCAPSLIDFELANVAVSKVRRGHMTPDEAAMSLDRLAALDLARHAIQPAEVMRLAAHCDLSAYDAAYLWLAATLAAPLATFDARLGLAAARHLSSESPAAG